MSNNKLHIFIANDSLQVKSHLKGVIIAWYMRTNYTGISGKLRGSYMYYIKALF